MKNKIINILIISAVLLLASLFNAHAFSTYRMWGGTIHQNISTSALIALGISEDSFQAIDDGNTAQDKIGTENFETPSHHFDNNRLAAGVQYVNNKLAKIINLSANSDKDKDAWYQTLRGFGELLHTVQDFYAHTNYVELKLKENPALNPGDLPLINWADVAALSPSKEGLKSGYFFYKNLGNNEKTNRRYISARMIKMEYKTTNFASDKEYEAHTRDFNGYISYAADTPVDVLHRDLNKDDGKSAAGAVVNPSTGKSLHEYAFNLAVRETGRQWLRLEEAIKDKYPDKADKIILALKKGVGTAKIIKGPLVEAIDVPADKPEPVKTTSALNQGEYYVIEAAGAYSDWEDKSDGVDAYYCYAEWRVGAKPEVWKQLLLDDKPMFEIAEENGDPTDYNSGHFYSTYITGNGGALKLQISDAIVSSADNHGKVEVRIYRGIVQ